MRLIKSFSLALPILAATTLLPGWVVADSDFCLPVMDVFMISGKGLVVTGQVASGSVTRDDVVCLVSAADGSEREITVSGIEQFRKLVDSATEGEFVGLLLAEVQKGEVAKGDEIRGDC
jgi:elongation factor Tu